jgi:methionyl-tRNA formyltransferase
MRIVRELDAGPVLATRATTIGNDETSEAVERRLAGAGADLLLETLDDMESGRARETPQDDLGATYAPRLAKDEGLIDWTAAAEVIHNKVRGLHPWPHAYTYLDHTRYLVLESAVAPANDVTMPASSGGIRQPGEIVDAARGILSVATGGGGRLRLLRLQPEGRRAMNVREFLAGHRLSPGMVFGPD